jgi:sugar lactone lactonase YvrE
MSGRWRWVWLFACAALVAAASAFAHAVRSGDDHPPRVDGSAAAWTTVFRDASGIEGLTGDDAGNLYVADRGNPCKVWRIDPDTRASVVVGTITPPCAPSGLTFDDDGNLYVTGGGALQDQIDVLRPDEAAPPVATVYATGVPGANGLAFDRHGNLWTGDGTTAQGRVWRIPPGGGAGVEVFRIPAMANDVLVGRDVRTLPPGTINPVTRTATNSSGSQPLVANGVAFTQQGDLLVADTARGAIWRVELDRNGDVESRVGCDTTYPKDTLCLDDVWVQHPYLEGIDGIALDRAGDVWAAANERNAILVVDAFGRTIEFFRNPPAATQLRNAGPLELPTSPFLSGHRLCVTQSDGNRRDNSPNTLGEGPKISCLDQRLPIPGLPLPVL